MNRLFDVFFFFALTCQGIQGVKGQEGELFGLLNLLKHNTESFNSGTTMLLLLSYLPLDLLSKAQQEEREDYRIEERKAEGEEMEEKVCIVQERLFTCQGPEAGGISADLFLDDTSGILDLSKIRNGASDSYLVGFLL